MPTTLRFAEDADIERYERAFKQHVPKEDGSWDSWHQEAMDEIERRLRTKRGTTDVFELGRLGQRSRDHLRPIAAWFAIHFAYVAADRQGSEPDTFFARKAAYYWQRATSALEAEAATLDYDFSNDGNVTPDEQQRPFISRILRG